MNKTSFETNSEPPEREIFFISPEFDIDLAPESEVPPEQADMYRTAAEAGSYALNDAAGD